MDLTTSSNSDISSGGVLKRPRTECKDSNLSLTSSVPSYLIVHSSEKNLTQVSPFLIQKALLGLAGTLKSVKKLRSGDLLIETNSKSQSSSLLCSTHLADIPIIVTPHTTLNSSRGVISEFDLQSLPESEIQTELSSQGVTAVRRIYMHRNGEKIPSKHLILTFNTPRLPTDIKAGYLNCPVRPYIPSPLRCFRCQRFGHSQTACRGSATCVTCGNAEHDGQACSSKPKCVNCKNEHASSSKFCPRWKEENEIQRVKILNNISYIEARKRVLSSLPRETISYAAAVKSTNNVSVQTDMTFPPSYIFESPEKTLSSKKLSQSTQASQSPTLSSENKKPLVSKSNSASVAFQKHKSKGLSKKLLRQMDKRPPTKISSELPLSCSEISVSETEMDFDTLVPQSNKKILLKRNTTPPKTKIKL